LRSFRNRAISRSRIVERLDRAAQFRLTILTAPAGYGKTTALREFVAASGEPNVEVELGRVPVAATALALAVARALEPFAAGALAAVDDVVARHGDAPDAPERLAFALAAPLAPLGGTISLDGLSAPLLADPALRRLLVALVENDANDVRWLLATRAAGGLPIASWMAYGLADAPLAAADLRFTRAEAAAVAQASQVPLDEERLDELYELTGGWPGPFVLALRTPPQPDRAHGAALGSHRVLLDYLGEHVYEPLGEAERDFLLAASVLPVLDAAAVPTLGRHDVRAMLDRVRDALPLFESDAPGAVVWQPLLRAYFEHRLRARGDEAYRKALVDLAATFERAEEYGPALDLFVRAAAAPEVERLLEAHGFAVLDGGALEAVSAAVALLLRSNRAQSPTMLSLRATFESSAGNFARANALFQQSLDGVDDRPAYVLLLTRYVLDLLKRNDGASLDIVRRLLPLLEATDSAPAGNLHVTVLGTCAIAYTMLDRAADAQAAIGAALELVSAAEDVSLQATIYHQASYIAYVAGDAQRAGRMAAAASRLALEARNHRLAVRSFSIRYSIAAGLEDDPERALEYLDAMIASAEKAGDRAMQLDALAGKLDIAAERGDDGAIALIEQRIAACEHGVDVQSSAILPAKALKAAWDGDFRLAYDLVAGSAGAQPGILRRGLRWAETGIYAAASGQREVAAEAVANALHDVRSVTLRNVEDRRRFARSLAACAVTQLTIGNASSANGLISELERSRREMSLRTRTLVEAVRALYLRVEVDNSEPAPFERLAAVGYGGLARLFAALPLARGSATSSISFLTRAEIAVLRALARGGSSTKVAAELQRSVNTVNVHVKSIMRKLGCTTRHEAIAIAREHGLIL
jgi:LuxR family transcriptional regulator, maltose regulon positive regulatory protein